jgi:hypothetical protein
MGIDTAPKIHNDDEDDSDEYVACDNCESGTYVLFDGDKVCDTCGVLAKRPEGVSRTSNPWGSWVEHRRSHDDYSGWFGEDRIKMVGGFIHPYIED